MVLGSIFGGIATPTESAVVGCVGAIVLTDLYRKLSWRVVEESALETVKITTMVFAILIAMNLQTSFPTPPFGFSLFYLKGVCPSEVHTVDLYRGVIPFIIIQVIVLCSIVIFPDFYGFH